MAINHSRMLAQAGKERVISAAQDFQSNLSSKCSNAQATAKFIHSLHLGPALTLMRSFVHASGKLARAGYLHSLIALYTKEPVLSSLLTYAESFDEVALFFTAISQIADKQHQPEADILERPDLPPPNPLENEQDGTVIQSAELSFNPTAPADSQFTAGTYTDVLKVLLQKHAWAVRCVAGLLVFICAIFGIKQVLKIPDAKEFLTAATALGTLIGNGKNIWATIMSASDVVLKIVYSVFGIEYVRPEHQHYSSVADHVARVYKKAVLLQQQCTTDSFGVLASGLPALEREYDSLLAATLHLSDQEKSMYNFNSYLTKIAEVLESMRDAIKDLYKSSVGKQHPTVLWVAGRPGSGKTHLVNQLAAEVAKEHNSVPYSRNKNDQYWSGYRHQAVVTIDDINQYADGKDVEEFHAYSTEDSRDVIGASITDKGRPFTSPFLMCSSNSMWIAPPSNLKDYFAANRRRTFAVFAWNPAAEAEAEANGGTIPVTEEFWSANPTKYYFYNPVYGAAIKNSNIQTNMKFNPHADYVIRETTYDEIKTVVLNQERFYREQFRKRFVKVFSNRTERGFTVPTEPFDYNEDLLPEKLFSRKVQVVPEVPEAPASLDATDADIMGYTFREDKQAVLNHFDIKLVDGHWVSPKIPLWISTRGRISATAAGEPVMEIQRARMLRGPVADGIILDTPHSGQESRLYISYTGDGLVQQSNFVTTTHKRVYQPSVMIYGPPGTGKTWCVQNAFGPDVVHEFSWVDEIDRDALRGQVVLLDDFLLDADRLAKSKKLVSDYYQKNDLGIKLLILTANTNTTFTQTLPTEDMDFFQRRSHVIRVEYSRMCSVYATTFSMTLAEAANTYEPRDRALSCTWKLYGKSWQFQGLTPSLEATRQLLVHMNTEAKQVQEKIKFNNIILPAPQRPDAIINFALNDNGSPNVRKTILIKCKYDEEGNRTEEVQSYATMAAMFATCVPLMVKLQQSGILNPQATVDVVNELSAMLELPYQDIIVNVGGRCLGITSIQGRLLMYNIEHTACPITYTELGMWMMGTFYPYENQTDVNVADFISRITRTEMVPPTIGKDIQIFRPLRIKTIQEFAEASPVLQSVRNVLAVGDIAMSLGAVFTIALDSFAVTNAPAPQEQVDDTQPEGHRQLRGGKDYGGVQDDTDRQTHRFADLNDADTRRRKADFNVDQEALDAYHDIMAAKAVRGARATGQYYVSADPGGRGGNRIYEQDGKKFVVSYNPDTGKYERVYLECAIKIDRKKMYRVRFARADEEHKYLDTLEGVLFDGQIYYAHPVDRHQTSHIGRVLDASKTQYTIRAESPRNVGEERTALDLTRDKEYTCGYGFNTFYAHYFTEHCGLRDNLCPNEGCNWADLMPPLRIARSQGDGTKPQGMHDPEALERVRLLENNRVEVVDAEGQSLQYAMMLKQRIGITTHHVGEDFRVRHKDKVYDVRILQTDPNNDLQTFEITDVHLNAFPSITGHIPTREQMAKYFATRDCELSILLPLKRDQLTLVQFCNGKINTQVVAKKGDNGRFEYVHRMSSLGTSGVTENGDCGSPVILVAPQMERKFAGIHIRGARSKSVGAMLTAEYLETMVTRPESNDGLTKQSRTILHPNIHYTVDMEDDDGTVPQFRAVGVPTVNIHVPRSTTKYRTGFEWRDAMYVKEMQTEPSIISFYDPRTPVGRDLFEEALMRYSGSDPYINPDEIDVAVEDIGQYLVTLFKSKDKNLRLLTTTEAINTPPVAEYPSAKPVDRTGSVGFPYAQINTGKASKGAYLEQRSDLKWYFKKDDKDAQTICSDVNVLTTNGMKGIHVHQPWVAYLKDEAVKLKKIYEPEKVKTRMFFSGTFAYYLAYRKAFGAAMFRMTEVFEDIPPKIGINARGLEWNQMFSDMLGVSDVGFASDMANWDGNVPRQFLEALPRIYNILYRHLDPDWKPEHDTLRLTLHKSIEGSLVIAKNRVYKFEHGMTSGFPGTAIENSLVNWMLFYLVYRRIMFTNNRKSGFAEFTRDVKLAVYGDDNVCAVRRSAIDVFHFNSFRVTAALYGFTVTDAAKQGGQQPDFIRVLDCEFLKRTTQKVGAFFVGALDFTSIVKSLTWVNSKPSYEFEGKWRYLEGKRAHEELVHAALLEVACHGREAYERFVEEMREASRGKDFCPHYGEWSDTFHDVGYAY